MDTAEMTELTRAQCTQLLATTAIGRLATTSGSLPVIFPVRFAMFHGDPVFRARRGSRLHRATHGQVLCLEIDSVGLAGHSGWSVVVVGRGETVVEPERVEACEQLPLRPWSSVIGDDVFLRVEATMVSGRRLDPLPVHPSGG